MRLLQFPVLRIQKGSFMSRRIRDAQVHTDLVRLLRPHLELRGNEDELEVGG